MTAAAPQDLLAQPLGVFLDEVAAPQPAPGGGAVSAVAVGLAAGLTAMAAGFSTEHLRDASEIRAEAESLRARAAPLAERDAAAYTAVLAAFALPKGDPGRREQVRRALGVATDVPLEVAEVGAAVLALVARLESRGSNPNLRGDVVTARLVAAAAVRSAATLVELNLADDDEPRVVRARSLADQARRATA